MMRVSTKGRYALRMMIDLAQTEENMPIALRDIAQRQQIPIKYTENIISLLLRAGLVKSTRGKSGGYHLRKAPSEYQVYDIIAAAEGNLTPVQCLDSESPECPMQNKCATLPIWRGLNEVVRNYLSSITLADVCHSEKNAGPCFGEKE